MASISTDKADRRRVLFVDEVGNRKTIYLGTLPKRQAEAVRLRVEQLVTAKLTGHTVDAETARWLAEAPKALTDKLARAGLIPRRKTEAGTMPTLDAFIAGYLADRPDVAPSTMLVLEQARRWLVRFLGADRPLDSITTADADAYKAFLIGERKQARSTVAKWVRYARHFLEVAKRRKLVADNPFAHLKGAVKGDPARRKFIPAADVDRVIDVAPDPQWKLLIGLARYGGLRMPSEALALTWGDVDWAKNRFVVRASKTAHHADGGIRVVPIFPELLPLLQAVYDAAPEGSTFVITRYRDTGANLRTQLNRYIVAAGLTPWGKPWQNLRVSRATELAEQYPSHVAAAWLGHTEKIADAFYRQVTEDHFAEATRQTTRAVHARGGTERKAPPTTTQETLGFPAPANCCKSLLDKELGGTGLEQTADSPGNPAIPAAGNAPDDARGARDGVHDADLERVVRAWPALPEAVRRQVVKLIDKAVSTTETTGSTEGR